MDQKPGISFESDATVFGFSGDVWSLRGVSGELFGKTFPIDRTFTIGRASDCDLVLASKQVSRQHANISLLGNVLVIDDLQSANGTFLNNHRITDQMELHEGDQIAFYFEGVTLASNRTGLSITPADDNPERSLLVTAVVALATDRSPAQLIELVTLAGQYHTISFLTNALGVALEPAALRFSP